MSISLTLNLDDYDLQDFLPLAAAYGQATFDYVVTPNIDHLIRYIDDPGFRELYAQAGYILLDSRLLARILSRTRGLRPRVCPGSDLTAGLFGVIAPRDRIVLIGASDQQAQALRQIYSLENLQHYNPPMGFIRDPAAVEATLRFIEGHSPFRYCFLAVGCPQQEKLACALKQRGVARGLGLCIGASINFLTGAERRAPMWMQRCSLEWLYRLLQDPGRLARRYLVRGPRIFALLPRVHFTLRRTTDSGGERSTRAPIG